MKKTVISLVGMIGSGKTTLLNELIKDGYETLPEGYITKQGYSFDNRLILSQWKWIGNWFERVVTFFEENEKKTYVFVDSSALVSGIWTSHCTPLFQPLQISFDELRKLSFDFINIELYCDKEVLIRRIQERLKIEPIRRQYNETNIEFINDLYLQYQNHTYLWDYRLNSTNRTSKELKDELINFLKKRIDLF